MEERTASLFQPDILLSSQYLENCSARAYLEPEKMLMLAVLGDAIACFEKYFLTGDPRYSEAAEWIWGEESDWLFSFQNICEVLGLSTSYVRQALLRWKERKLRATQRSQTYSRRKARKKQAA